MEYKFTRTFHPVGQGAFYSERHKSFNVVYDCGEIHLSNNAKSVVQNAFTKDDDIDLLFISHFDYDHISLISTLQNSVRRIKRVVLPLLDKSHTNVLVNISGVLSQDIINIVSDPQMFFGEHTEVIFVKPAPDEQEVESDPASYNLFEIQVLRDEETGKIEIDSGTRLSFGDMFRWVFVPYNYFDKVRSSQLKRELVSAGFDVTKLENDSNYTIRQITSDYTRRKLKRAYSLIDARRDHTKSYKQQLLITNWSKEILAQIDHA